MDDLGNNLAPAPTNDHYLLYTHTHITFTTAHVVSDANTCMTRTLQAHKIQSLGFGSIPNRQRRNSTLFLTQTTGTG